MPASSTALSHETAAPNRLTDNGHAPSRARSEREGGQVAEMQRRRLLLAITEVIGDSGIEAATVGRVCEQAGVSRRTFYELFRDREACLLAAFEAQVERLARELEPIYARRGRWAERLGESLRALLERLDADPDTARLCVVESLRAGPAVLERRRAVVEALASFVDEGRSDSRTGAGPPPLTAQGVVGGVLSLIHARLLDLTRPASTSANGAPERPLLIDLAGELVAMIVHPYLGAAAARKELSRPTPRAPRAEPRVGADPFRGLPIRFTYRTARVLGAIASSPGTSNRHVGRVSGIADDGQVSRLLSRLRDCGLIANSGGGHGRGEANAWSLTERGRAIHEAIEVRA